MVFVAYSTFSTGGGRSSQNLNGGVITVPRGTYADRTRAAAALFTK